MPDPASHEAPLAHAFARFASGVAMVAVRLPGVNNVQGRAIVARADAFNSVSLDPPLVLWTVHRDAEHAASLRAASTFHVHVLAHDQAEVTACESCGASGHAGLGVAPGQCAAWFACDAVHVHEEADHLIFIARITGCGSSDRLPLVKSAGQYIGVRAHPHTAT